MKRKKLIIILSIVAAVLIAGIIITIIVISNNGKCEDHTYDNACDAICNVCGETREVSEHQWDEADCLNPKICKVCGVKEGNALGHTAEEDDGDCTTEVKCIVCQEVIIPANNDHIAHADDGDCTTPVICTECDIVIVEAKTTHDHLGEWLSDSDGHWHVCKNEGCNVTEEKRGHKSGGAATETMPEKCTVCDYVISPEIEHIHNHNMKKHDDTNHWDECRCSDKINVTPHSAENDGDCTTADKCTCGYTVTAPTDHVAGEDDGNCTTPIKCENCEQNAKSGTTEHTDSDHDHLCDNPGCQVAVNPPVDTNPGIDLPIDRN